MLGVESDTDDARSTRGYFVASLLLGIAFAPAFLAYSSDTRVALGLTAFVAAIPAAIGLVALALHRFRIR